jgi:hypothetical protein
MDIIEYVEKLDTMFVNITKDYKFIYENIHNYLNDGKVSYNQIMDFEVSLEDLSIQLNSLVFLFKQIQIDSLVLLFNQKSNQRDTNSTDSTNDVETTMRYKENKLDNLDNLDKLDSIIEKTLFNYIPLLFIYFMIFDKESILHLKDFIEKPYVNTNKSNDFQYIIEPIDE